jgi:spermidine synthase
VGVTAEPDRPVIVDRAATPIGELVLRRHGNHHEVICNGVFLMDTRDGRSERLLVEAALCRHPAPRRLLIAGLGVGFTLRAALTAATVEHVTVVEIAAALVGWHRADLSPHSADALDDPRVDVVVADLADYLHGTDETFDVVCLDVDNGPAWTVHPANAGFYSDAGTARLAGRLTSDGVLAVWSAAPDRTYEVLLDRHFRDVQVVEVPPFGRGQPDVVMTAVRR